VKRNRMRWFSSVLVPAISVGLLAVVARAYVAPPPTVPREADVQHAERIVSPEQGADERLTRPEGNFVGGNGVVEPAARETSVAGDVPGRIARIAALEGQHVAVGTLLVELEHAAEDAAVAAAHADVEVARAELLRAVRGTRREEVRAAIAEYDAARARAELSAGVLSRLQTVSANGGATVDEVDRAAKQAAVDAAASEQSAARRDAAIEGTRREDVQAARARVAAAEARLRQSEASRNARFVHAPHDGEILQSKFRVGEYYQPGGAEPLLVLGDTQHLRVRTDVDERDIAQVRLGAPAILRVPAYPGRDLRGKVVEIGRRMGRKNIRTDDPVERRDTKILEVVIALDDGHAPLVVGQRGMAYVSVDP